MQYRLLFSRLLAYFHSLGGSATTAQQQATAWIGRQIRAQASLLAYLDVFHALMLLAALVIPLALILRNVRLAAQPAPPH